MSRGRGPARPGRSPREPRPRASSDRLLTTALVVLSLTVGAFLASLAQRWASDAAPDDDAARAVRGVPAVGGIRDRATHDAAGPVGETPGLNRARIRVEVLNASRVAGLADRVTALLRTQGFDVVNYGNAGGPTRRRSEIVDRVGNAAFAREVALALPRTPIQRRLAPDGFVDVTVVLGADAERFVASASPDERGEVAGPLERALARLREALRP